VTGVVHGSIVVAGEALIDLVRAPDGSLSSHPGGGPYNVARTLGRLERPVSFLGGLSTDAFGVQLREQLQEDGVALDAAVTTTAPTTLALAQVDAAGVASYRFYEAGTSAPALTLAATVLPERIEAFYVGTLGLVFEPMASTLETLVGRLGDETLVALDPNCRPATIADPDAYRARLQRLLRRADVVKVSEEDLDWLEPGADPATAARRLLGAPEALALVTLGGDGALVVTPESELPVRAPAIEVVDTIGAGDAFMGAFLASWSEQGLGRDDLTRLDAVERAARFGCRVAAIACERAGADPPRLAELRAPLV
jgi:fructokinase